jgi:hypothetical protein
MIHPDILFPLSKRWQVVGLAGDVGSVGTVLSPVVELMPEPGPNLPLRKSRRFALAACLAAA